MKLKENMLAHLRALLKQGPAAATNAIQQALQGLHGALSARTAGPGARQMTYTTSTRRRRHRRAPKPPPLPPARHAARAERLVPDLLARLGAAGMARARRHSTCRHSRCRAWRRPGRPPTFRPTARQIHRRQLYQSRPARARIKLYIPSTYARQAFAADGDAARLHPESRRFRRRHADECTGRGKRLPRRSIPASPSRPMRRAAGTGSTRTTSSATRANRRSSRASRATIMRNYAVDRRQVYVAGLSAGGAMAAIMGTLYPDLYAAVGVHSGLPFAAAHDLPSALAAMKGNVGRAPRTVRHLPIIVFHGDRDTTVHPANGDAVIAQRARRGSDAVVIEPGRVPDGHAYTRTVHRRARRHAAGRAVADPRRRPRLVGRQRARQLYGWKRARCQPRNAALFPHRALIRSGTRLQNDVPVLHVAMKPGRQV